MMMATLGEIELDKLAVCCCGRNEPALFFCNKIPVCERKTTEENGKVKLEAQLIYCMTCSSESDSCHDHRQTLVSVKCKELH
jgi:hypothetical protein